LGDTTVGRVLRYSAVRLITLIVTVIIGVYLTILIANMGGYVDTILRNDIRDRTTQTMLSNPSFPSSLQSSARS
jgi:peptide/nickel transport system permease protein